MHLFRYSHPETDAPRLGIETDNGHRYDATATDPQTFASVGAWLASPDPVGAVHAVIQSGDAPDVPEGVLLLAPVDTSEVWASGVTYERSRSARRDESPDGGDFYDRVYVADRPELFFKCAGWRVVAPGGLVRVRRDSVWDVPEPEMVLVVSAGGAIVGVTAGNDMSSRSIEGENPLYLPQAKTYTGSCAIGASIEVAPFAVSLRDRAITLRITRSGAEVFAGQTSTAQMKRSPEELVAFVTRETDFPQGVFLFTGTGIVPSDNFTLQSGDGVAITLAGVPVLENTVE